MIRRRALAAGIKTKVGNHTFRATGITAYLQNGGTLEIAADWPVRRALRLIQRPDSARDLLPVVALDHCDIVLALQVKPELRAIAEIAAEPDGRIGADRAAAIKDLGDAPGGHAKIKCKPVCAKPPCNQLAPQHAARMRDRTPSIGDS